VLRSVSTKGDESITEVAADDAVPGRAVVLIELFLDVLGDVLLHGVLLEGLPPKQNPQRTSPSVRRVAGRNEK
jgi:hypothetical protein